MVAVSILPQKTLTTSMTTICSGRLTSWVNTLPMILMSATLDAIATLRATSSKCPGTTQTNSLIKPQEVIGTAMHKRTVLRSALSTTPMKATNTPWPLLPTDVTTMLLTTTADVMVVVVEPTPSEWIQKACVPTPAARSTRPSPSLSHMPKSLVLMGPCPA